MQKSIGLRPDVYAALDDTFDDFPNGMYMSYGELISELIREHKEYIKIKDGVN